MVVCGCEGQGACVSFVACLFDTCKKTFKWINIFFFPFLSTEISTSSITNTCFGKA